MNKIRPIKEVASRFGMPSRLLKLYGDHVAKVSLDALSLKKHAARPKYILVSGMTPTPFGEGKTVTTIGLSMALNRIGLRAACAIRQPSLGPIFGVKGGGVGGGRSKALPPEEINFYLTGDMHAVESAHNLCAAFVDNHLFRGNMLGIDYGRIFWKRVLDVNDRTLRSIKTRVGPAGGEATIETGFDITAASELMAVLALSESIRDLRKRLGRIVIGFNRKGRPVTADDIKVAGAMAALLHRALEPNIVQTSEGTPCFVHTGPFANITHGNSSVVADKVALGFADVVVTESGFGADCGAEKFFDIKCRQSGLRPDLCVLVCSVRAVKAHSGRYHIVVGRNLDRAIYRQDVSSVEEGVANLMKQIRNITAFGVPCIVAINGFASDFRSEHQAIRRAALGAGAAACVTSELYAKGSCGGEELAEAVQDLSKSRAAHFKYLYPDNASIKEKIHTIATRMYGAKDVSYSPKAEDEIKLYTKLGYGRLPVCMAKTHLSLSHDPKLKGAPSGFILPIRDLRPSIGAGFLYALCGATMTMPGLPTHPAGERIDVDARGSIRGVEL